ncbi:hypothetical protein HZA98_00550 [Candidatus Woesearchaeota archaeon]|nr:hypothetical protein [Candidatus Woesearchaeota archaeon]
MGSKDSAGIIVIVLIVLLLLAGVYVFIQKPTTAVLHNYQYGNGNSIFNVTKVSNSDTRITIYVGSDQQPYDLILRNDPLSLENISVSGTVNTRIFNAKHVFITINPEANLSGKTTLAALEIDKIIDNPLLYNLSTTSAMTLPNDMGYPEVSCYDATSERSVILLTLGSETQVFTDGYCIIIEGTTEDNIIRAADRFDLTLLGIMKADTTS